MYVLSKEGQEAFSVFMSTLLTQIGLGSITLLLLYRASHLSAMTGDGIIFWIFTISIATYFIYWCFCSFMQFIRPLSNDLDSRIEQLGIELNDNDSFKQFVINIYRRVKLAWHYDRTIFWQVVRLFLALEIPAIFLFFASGLGAVQLATALGW